MRVIVHADFTDFSGLNFGGDACFWCLGITSTGMTEADYSRVTHDYTLAAAKVLVRPTMTFVFRPAMIQALHGIKSRTRLYSVPTRERVGQAMLRVVKKGFSKKVLENVDINAASREI